MSNTTSMVIKYVLNTHDITQAVGDHINEIILGTGGLITGNNIEQSDKLENLA